MRLLLSLLLLFVACAPAAAQEAQEQAARTWRELARIDSEAALALVAEHHPGAVPALGDAAFSERLEAAKAHVAERLPRVRDYFGYTALMTGLAADFRDGHIWTNAILQQPVRAWTGLILTRRGGAWRVGAQERQDGEPDLAGHRLVACDGVDADRWAAERIGLFRGDPAIEARLAGSAAWLLVRDGNPFLDRVKSCTFEGPDGSRREWTLAWRQTQADEIQRVAARAERRAAAGMGVSPFDGGFWISLETLDNRAAEVVKAVEARQDALRAAPTVVLDLRGNSGGNSAFAGSIAAALVGRDRAMWADRPATECRGAHWRATADNLEAIRSFRRNAEGKAARAQLDGLDRQIAEMEKAIAEKRPFAPELPDCAKGADAGAAPPDRDAAPASAMGGRLVLVTDRSCFSSCLIAADMFRRLGATHVGEATDVSSRYMEVREILLPSGLRTFSTLQKVAVGLGDYGPYSPDIAYPGDLADDDALKAWVAALPVRR